uniref:hyaluronan-binding protein 2-like n=1 Tax=Myxine glutinosa TaxID=7769 RepID=UPI00358E1262
MALSSAWTFTFLCVLSVTHGRFFRKDKSVVTTEGGTAPTGSHCHFPFMMSGIRYNECVPDPEHRLWCGTTADVETDRQWGYCKTTSHTHFQISFGDDEDDSDGVEQWDIPHDHEGEMDDDDDNHDFWDEETSNDPCDANPCLHQGVCTSMYNEYSWTFQKSCTCHSPYHGKHCQKVKNPCRTRKCRNEGICIIKKGGQRSKCSCSHPFYGKKCNKVKQPCNPSPCQNGGTCETNDQHSYRCICPEDFTGKHCEADPQDCYSGNGQDYRGEVAQTENDHDCIPWNAGTLVHEANNALQLHAESSDLGNHNHCRNPDGDKQPWCYVLKKEDAPSWEYCKLKSCDGTEVEIKPIISQGEGDFSVCGKAEEMTFPMRIVGGQPARQGSRPWIVSIQRKVRSPFGEQNIHDCGGSLIAPCWILTAAHCLYSRQPSDLRVVLGEHQLDKKDEGEQIFDVERLVSHEDSSRDHPHNDIALMKLTPKNGQCVKETTYVRLVCLPAVEEDLKAGTNCDIAGWGADRHTGPSIQVLQEVQVKVIGRERCNEPRAYDGKITSSMLCAGNFEKGGVDSCQGDSGGPLTTKSDTNIHTVHGVVSFGEGCGESYKPGVYARVSHYIPWIKAYIFKE